MTQDEIAVRRRVKRAERVREFVKWMEKECELESPGNDYLCFDSVELGNLRREGAGFGVFTKRTIRLYETLIRLPRRLMITASVVADLPGYSTILKRVKLEPAEVLALFFFLEHLSAKANRPNVTSHPVLSQFFLEKGNRGSLWEPYLRVLPTRFHTPMEKYKLYDGLAPPIEDLCQQIPEPGAELFRTQLNEFDRCYGKVLQAVGWCPCEYFKWAWHIVNTRCIYVESSSGSHPLVDNSRVEDTIAVVPLIDMFNHSPRAQCTASYDKFTQTYCVTATQAAVAEGEQIFLCYGPHDNVRLWIEYGFTLGSTNISNNVPISTAHFLELAAKVTTISKKHEELIRKLGLLSTIYGCDDGPSYGLKRNCLILALDERELWRWKKVVFDEESETDAGNFAESDRYIPKTLQILHGVLTHLREELRSGACKVASNGVISGLWQERIELVQRIMPANDNHC